MLPQEPVHNLPARFIRLPLDVREDLERQRGEPYRNPRVGVLVQPVQLPLDLRDLAVHARRPAVVPAAVSHVLSPRAAAAGATAAHDAVAVGCPVSARRLPVPVHVTSIYRFYRACKVFTTGFTFAAAWHAWHVRCRQCVSPGVSRTWPHSSVFV